MGAQFKFNAERKCPACGAAFGTAEPKPEVDPVIVVVWPKCGKLLWRPGSNEKDAGGI